ncbi:hypothetical protein MPLSOD_10345 [Mesorhizobium sp. SOD10]|nr:hypothetical protein MPLSOD_10345 [Mesorhizobium sp. SOD10]
MLMDSASPGETVKVIELVPCTSTMSPSTILKPAVAASAKLGYSRKSTSNPGQFLATMISSLLQISCLMDASVTFVLCNCPVRSWRATSSVALAITSWPANEMQLSRMAKTRSANGMASIANSIAVLPRLSLKKPGRDLARTSLSVPLPDVASLLISRSCRSLCGTGGKVSENPLSSGLDDR